MVLAETFHHSSAPFPPKFKEDWAGRHEQHDALRGQNMARTREAPYYTSKTSVAGDTEFFSLYEEELGGARPDRLAGVRPQARVQRHTVEHSVDVSPSAQTLDAPVPQMGNELLDVFKLLDTVLPEQVIDVPEISQDSIQQRLVDQDLRHAQTAERLVEVPTILFFLKQRIPGQIVDNPVSRSRGRRLQRFLPQQSSTAQSAEQLVDIPIHGGSLQGFRPGQGSQRTDEQIADIPRGGSSSSSHSPAGVDDVDDAFQGVFQTFPRNKKSARVTWQVTAGVVMDTSSWTPAAYERSELVDDTGHVWVRLDTVHGSCWKNTQHSQRHPPWES